MALTDTLTDIGDAIRTKEGTAELIPLADMPERILSLPSGGGEPPELGFVPTEWNANGYITKGRWYGAKIPGGAFASETYTSGGFIYLEELEHDSITTLGVAAFKNCAKLLNADFPLILDIPDFGFTNCRALESISAPRAVSISTSGVSGCISLTSVNAPLLKSIGSNAFNGCSSLAEADFPKVTNLNNGAFYNCSKLERVNLPLAPGIYSATFYKCVALTAVNMPKASTIGSGAFNGCSSLAVVDFPLVASISADAFKACAKLDTIILRRGLMVSLANVSAFTSTPIASGTGYVYVPAALVDSYKVATNWATYADQIRAIEDYPEITGGAA